MIEDFLRMNQNHIVAINKALEHVNYLLESMGKDINNYHLVNYKVVMSEAEVFMKEINEELNIGVSERKI